MMKNPIHVNSNFAINSSWYNHENSGSNRSQETFGKVGLVWFVCNEASFSTNESNVHTVAGDRLSYIVNSENIIDSLIYVQMQK